MLNKVILMGRLAKDPDLRYTTSNIATCSFTLAVERDFKGADGKKEADFIQIVAWRNTAEFCSKYYKKGMQVAITGRLQTRTWDDQEGKRHYATEVVIDDAYFAEGKKEGQAQENNQPDIEGFMPIEAGDDLPF